MVSVTVGNNLDRKAPKTYTPNTTLRAIFEDAGISYTFGLTTLNGSVLSSRELDEPLSNFGLDGSEGHDSCSLTNIVKADNA